MPEMEKFHTMAAQAYADAHDDCTRSDSHSTRCIVWHALAQGFDAAQGSNAFKEILERQITWSKETFGPLRRTQGVIEHIQKELEEIKADPTDVEEWVDVMILAFDGAWRHSGLTAQQIMEGYAAKMLKNFERKWPDWRGLSDDHPIEHIRDNEDEVEWLDRKAEEATNGWHEVVIGMPSLDYLKCADCGRTDEDFEYRRAADAFLCPSCIARRIEKGRAV